MIFYGWFERALIYNGSLFGFLKGEYFLFLKLKVTSRKTGISKFASMAICKQIITFETYCKTLSCTSQILQDT